MTERAKPINPYQRLQDEMRKYASAVEFPTRKLMWMYPKAKVGEAWHLAALAERVAAADQLGFRVELKNTDEGLQVWYVKRPPERPYSLM
jgi:hypothetical protein